MVVLESDVGWVLMNCEFEVGGVVICWDFDCLIVVLVDIEVGACFG